MFHKLAVEFLHLSQLLLTHGLTQSIRLTSSEVRQLTREQHHLLLIHTDAVGVLEIFLHAGEVVLDLLPTLLAGDEIRNVVHRSRAVEGVHSDDVTDDRRLQLAEVFLHSRRLKLEGADGIARGIQGVGLRVIDRDMVDVDVDASGLLDILQGILDERQSFESQKVHLDEAHILDDLTFVLGDHDIFIGFLVFDRSHGGHIGEVRGADDDPTGVDTDLTVCAFQF